MDYSYLDFEIPFCFYPMTFRFYLLFRFMYCNIFCVFGLHLMFFSSYPEGVCGRADVLKSFIVTMSAGICYVQTDLSQRDISTCTCHFLAAGTQQYLTGVRRLLVAGDVVTLQPPGVCPPPCGERPAVVECLGVETDRGLILPDPTAEPANRGCSPFVSLQEVAPMCMSWPDSSEDPGPPPSAQKPVASSLQMWRGRG